MRHPNTSQYSKNLFCFIDFKSSSLDSQYFVRLPLITSTRVNNTGTGNQTIWSGFQLSVVKPKTKLSLWQITNCTESGLMSQPNLVANSKFGNLCEQGTIHFGFTSNWMAKWRAVLTPIA